MCPEQWEEPVGIRRQGVHLWLSEPPSLWKMEPGLGELLWVLLLGARLHEVEELLLDSCRNKHELDLVNVEKVWIEGKMYIQTLHDTAYIHTCSYRSRSIETRCYGSGFIYS